MRRTNRCRARTRGKLRWTRSQIISFIGMTAYAVYASQPHWMTPITTVTPRLEQEYRYDQQQQFLQNGAEINNYFAGKGLELIPTETNEVVINVPGFQQRLPEGCKVKTGNGFPRWEFRHR